jgi:hypothetical protein
MSLQSLVLATNYSKVANLVANGFNQRSLGAQVPDLRPAVTSTRSQESF